MHLPGTGEWPRRGRGGAVQPARCCLKQRGADWARRALPVYQAHPSGSFGSPPPRAGQRLRIWRRSRRSYLDRGHSCPPHVCRNEENERTRMSAVPRTQRPCSICEAPAVAGEERCSSPATARPFAPPGPDIDPSDGCGRGRCWPLPLQAWTGQRQMGAARCLRRWLTGFYPGCRCGPDPRACRRHHRTRDGC